MQLAISAIFSKIANVHYWLVSCQFSYRHYFCTLMKTRAVLILIAFSGLAIALSACENQPENWVKAPKGLEISVYKDYDEGKPYLTTLYENFSSDTILKIRFQLLLDKSGHTDTVMKEIDPPQILRPKDRHSVPRHIGEDTLAADAVHVGQVWVVKQK